MSFTYEYPRPMVTVDALVFRRIKGRVEVLVIRRGNPPFAGELALPGGFLDMEEDLIDGACRELFEETGLKEVELEQLAAFGEPGRDPRGRSVSVVFVGIVKRDSEEVVGGDDAAEALWAPVGSLQNLAFDHDEILEAGLKWLKERENKKK